MEKNLQGLLEKLSNEVGNVRSLSNNLQNARASSVRNSIRLMNTQEKRSNEAHEGHLREVETRHREAISSKVGEFEERLTEIKKLLSHKDEELDMYKERLHECRKLKNNALEENVKIKERYQARNNELERNLTECKQKLLVLENERATFEKEISEAEDLHKELEEYKETVQNLHDKLKRTEEEIRAYEEHVEKLEGDREKLETALKEVQNQNEELSRQLSEALVKPGAEDQDEEFKKVLEERLNAVQMECEGVKATLKKEEEQYRELRKKYGELEYEHKLKKVDLRIAEREKKELVAKVEKSEKQTEEMAALEKVNTELNSRLKDLEESVKMLTEHLGEREKSIQDLKRVVDGHKEQNSSMELENVLLKKELEIAEVKLRDVNHLETILKHKEEVITKKNEEVVNKDRVIKQQKAQIGTLKELAMKMEEDMIMFEEKLNEKLAPLDEAEKIKNLLEGENKSLRENLNKCRVELNEAKSLKTFTEKRLQQTESSLKVQSQTKESQLAEIMEKMLMASRKNEEIIDEIQVLTRQKNDLEKDNFELRKKVEMVSGERDKVIGHYNNSCDMLVDAKHEIITLKEALQEALEKAETYKDRYQNEQMKLEMVKDEKKLDDLKTSTKMEQQKKLIEHLVEQLESQDKKKHIRGLFPPKKVAPAPISGIDFLLKSSTPTQSRRMEATERKTPAAPTGACPMPTTALEQEQLALNYLEKKRDNLRNQLESIHNTRNASTTPVRKTPTLPAPARKNEHIFKERANTISGTAYQTITGKRHEFLSQECEKDTNCAWCHDDIKTGRRVSQCVRCLDVYHIGCAPKAKATCLSS